MTNKQVEKIIWDEIQKRDITFYDMIGRSGHGVCLEEGDRSLQNNQASRPNRFNAVIGGERIKEILSLEECTMYTDYPVLKVSFQKLFMFWWNKCIERHLFIDEVLDDIYDYFTEQMRLPQKEVNQMEITLDFDQLPLFPADLAKAA